MYICTHNALVYLLIACKWYPHRGGCSKKARGLTTEHLCSSGFTLMNIGSKTCFETRLWGKKTTRKYINHIRNGIGSTVYMCTYVYAQLCISWSHVNDTLIGVGVQRKPGAWHWNTFVHQVYTDDEHWMQDMLWNTVMGKEKNWKLWLECKITSSC